MKILLAVDGSEFSRFAVDACVDLIETGKVDAIKVISVYEAQVPIVAEPVVVSSKYYKELNDLARNRTKTIVQEAKESILRQPSGKPIEVTTKVELGQPAPLIVETAKDWDADLIIVGSHGRGFWGRLALGSVSDAVVHHSPCSVLVVRNK